MSLTNEGDFREEPSAEQWDHWMSEHGLKCFVLGYYYAKCTSGNFKIAKAVFEQLENFSLAAKAAEIAIEEHEKES